MFVRTAHAQTFPLYKYAIALLCVVCNVLPEHLLYHETHCDINILLFPFLSSHLVTGEETSFLRNKKSRPELSACVCNWKLLPFGKFSFFSFSNSKHLSNSIPQFQYPSM